MYSILLLALLGQSRSQLINDLRPRQTAFGDLGGILGFSPMPTGVMRVEVPMLKKRALPDSICGYITGNYYASLTCDATEYCAVNTGIGAFGCCQTYSPLPNGEYIYSSCAFRTQCFDYTASDACTGSCASNTLNGYCTGSDLPYCQIFSLTDRGLSAFGCNTVSSRTVRARLTPTTTFSVAPNTDLRSQDIPGPTETAPSGTADVGTSASQTSTSQSSSSKSSVVGPAVGGAIGGVAVVLIAVGGFFWLRLKHKKQAAAAAAAAGSGVGGNNGPGSGPNVAAGAAAGGAIAGGAYAANEYYKSEDDPSKAPIPVAHETNQTTYAESKQAQAYGSTPGTTLGPSSISEMPGSPHPTVGTQNAGHGTGQSYAEVEGSNFSGPSAVSSGGHQIQRKSVGTNSLLSGSGGDRTELENASVSGIAQSPTSPAQSSQPGPTTGTNQTSAGLGYQAGPASDWNRPYHELE